METLAPLNRRNMAAHPILSPQEYHDQWHRLFKIHQLDPRAAAAVSCHQLVALTTQQLAVQTRMLAAADPGNKTAEIEASAARIKALEQELAAARALNTDAGGARLLELLTELLTANREMEARLASIDAKTCGCVVS